MSVHSETISIKIYADGADKASIRNLASDKIIGGFTTNPTLMRQAGVTDYKSFCKSLVQEFPTHPFSFEVFSDDFDEMYEQAKTIANWGKNVFVKVPVMNTKGTSSVELIARLSNEGVMLNVTAVMTMDQVESIVSAVVKDTPTIISIFAGRIADSGIDPVPLISEACEKCASFPKIEILWASTRELLNIFQAQAAGAHIITVTPDILNKIDNIGIDLNEFSRRTVAMFHEDSIKAKFTL